MLLRMTDAPLGSARKWAITFSVMMVTVMQVLDTSITNVALPHMQGSFSASIDEMSWVITSFLAANAVVIPATGWLTSVFGRRRFYLICTVVFTISAFLFDAPFHRRPRHVDLAGIALMVIGFGCLQLVLDLGERNDWFDSTMIVMLAVVAVVMLIGFMARELMASEPILDLRVFAERNFGLGTVAIFLVGLAFNSSILMVALYTQKILGYDAWTAGLTLAPGGLGTMIALMISGRLVSRMDQRLMLVGGCLLQAVALWLMTEVTSTMDFEALAWPRFVQGFSAGFIFVPLQALALANIPMERLSNATSPYNLVRNVGGSVGVALVTTMLVRRAQGHQATLGSHINLGSHEMAARLHQWTGHFLERGADTVTAGQQAMAMIYRELLTQSQVLAYADDFRLMLVASCLVAVLVPFMRRVRAPAERGEAAARDPGLPTATD